MKKFKKWYCIASVVFATVVLVLTLSMCTTQTAYATSAGSSTKTTSEKKSVPDAAEDETMVFPLHTTTMGEAFRLRLRSCYS